jgi:hypothetical protein
VREHRLFCTHVSTAAVGVQRLRVRGHRTMVGVTGCLRVLLNKVTTILGISHRKGRMAGLVERRINLHAAADIEVRRSGRKSVESGEEGRHDEVGARARGGRRLKTMMSNY